MLAMMEGNGMFILSMNKSVEKRLDITSSDLDADHKMSRRRRWFRNQAGYRTQYFNASALKLGDFWF
jgi:hypothetical protein